MSNQTSLHFKWISISLKTCQNVIDTHSTDRWTHTKFPHLQIAEDLRSSIYRNVSGSVLVAQKDICLVSVESRVEGHLGADLLSREVASLHHSFNYQAWSGHAQGFQMLVTRTLHVDGACIETWGGAQYKNK